MRRLLHGSGRLLIPRGVWPLLTLLILTTFMVAQGFSDQRRSINDLDGREVLTALDTMRQQWLVSTNFVCTYKLYAGLRQGLEEIRTLPVPPNGDNSHAVATGRLVKKGIDIRMTRDFIAPPSVERTGGGFVKATRVPFDEVVYGPIAIRYTPPANATKNNVPVGGSLRVFARPKALMTQPSTPFVSKTSLSPFKLAGDGDQGLFYVSDQPFSANDVHLTTSWTDPSRVKITLVYHGKQFDSTKLFIFWTAPQLPVLEKLVLQQTENGPPGRETFYEISYRQFVQVPGGSIPSDIIAIAGNAGHYTYRRWVSHDLGERLPTEDDFKITIPENVVVHGLKNPPRLGTTRTIDPTSITLKELAKTPNQRQMPIAGRESAEGTRGGSILAWIIGGNALLLLIICVGIVIRQWRK